MTEKPEASDPLQLVVGDYLINQLERQRLQTNLGGDRAVSTKPVAPPRPEAMVYDLRTSDGWSRFHHAFVQSRTDGLAPWFRCLGVLRGLKAATAVVERHYVCLDWRSEVAAFYAFLDAPRRNAVLRVHFFAEAVELDQISELTEPQIASYLGYIVVRESGLPLVGRTVIKLPTYLEKSVVAAVVETVHLFGQTLRVTGVPFMQQDSQFAVCAHIVAWMVHYSAFRRGIVERKLIAEFVTNSGSGGQPMRPAVREGLNLGQVTKLFSRMGLRCWDYLTPWASVPELPRFEKSLFPALATSLRREGVPLSTVPEFGDLTTKVERLWSDYMEEILESGDEPSAAHRACRAQDAVLGETLRPYLESGLPIYAGTDDHALLICGRGVVNDKSVHWVHDDQYGPYLRADSLMLLSRSSLRYQSGIMRSRQGLKRSAVPPSDRVERMSIRSRVTDSERAVRSIAVPAPSRAVLPCAVAEAHAVELVRGLVEDLESTTVSTSIGTMSFVAVEAVSTTIQMGIAYKERRRKDAIDRHETAAVVAWSSMHLAEWIVVVQAQVATDTVAWEIVYDGSSTTAPPRMQCVRVGKQMLIVSPDHPAVYTQLELSSELWPLVRPAHRFDKHMSTTGS